MANFASPGVFIEEAASSVQIVTAAGTSTLGVVGFTTQGPTNTPTLVTSYSQFTQIFGGLSADSYLPIEMAAFFANGGTRAYVVRVTPSDATSAAGYVADAITDQAIETGDGVVVAFSKTAGTTPLRVNAGGAPLVPSSVTLVWRGLGTPVAAQNLRNRADSAVVPLVNGTAVYEARVLPSALPAMDSRLPAIVQGTATLTWNPAGTPLTLPIPASGTATTLSATSGAGSVVTLDHLTGILSVKFVGADIPGASLSGNLQLAYTPATATQVVVDDGVGALTGAALASPGTIDYATGAYSFTTTGPLKPHNHAQVLATYTTKAWQLTPLGEGAWGNDLQMRIVGNVDNYTVLTNRYSAFDVAVMQKNSDGVYQVVESYEALDLDDPTSAQYFPSVINDLSGYVNVALPGAEESPEQLGGLTLAQVVAGGDDSSGGKVITGTLLNAPVSPRSFVLTWKNATVTKTIRDDGNGLLIGDIDATGTNTINYTSGAFSTKLVSTIDSSTLVSVSYATTAVTPNLAVLSAGSDGTFTTGTYGTNQLTTSTLSATSSGIYALNNIDEVMQVIVPDLAGDTTATGDIFDYVQSRVSQPSGGDRFAILSPPKGMTAQQASDWFRYTLGRYSDYAAFYWPWITVSNPLTDGRNLTVPPVAHVAGIYARTDQVRNVGKAPGGTVDGALQYLTGLERNPNQGDRDTVYQAHINPLINTPQTGMAVWGVRTASSGTQWRYVNVRRLFMFLEKSTYNSTQWSVFENNGPALWSRISSQLSGFLLNLFNQGYFKGSTPKDAFFVTCDTTNNTPESVNAGEVNITVGAAGQIPGEFVVFTFTTMLATS